MFGLPVSPAKRDCFLDSASTFVGDWLSPRFAVSGACIRVHYYAHSDQVRQTPRLQLLDNVSAVQLDGAKTDTEIAGDDLVGFARGHQFEDLTFARCQQRRAGLQSGAFE